MFDSLHLGLRHLVLPLIAALLLTSLFAAPFAAAAAAPAQARPTAVVTDAAAGKISFIGTDAGASSAASLHTTTLPFPLHERLWLAPDQASAYLSSPDGWVVKINLQTRQVTQQLRAGQRSSGMALSGDGRFLMLANLQPATLVAIDSANLSVIRQLDVADKNGKASGVAAIHAASARKSFIALMRDIPELWELSYDDHAEPVYEGLVHDYKMGEAIALRGPFPPRRTILEQPLSSFAFDTSSTHAIGANEDGLLQVINLDIRRKIRDLRFSSALRADAGVSWQRRGQAQGQGRQLLALPHENENAVTLLDMQSWQVLQKMTLAGKKLRLHSHERAPYVWIESRNEGQADQRIALLDKQSLSLLEGVPAVIASSSAPLAWPGDGAYVLLRSKDHKTLLLVETKTLELVQRYALSPELSR